MGIKNRKHLDPKLIPLEDQIQEGKVYHINWARPGAKYTLEKITGKDEALMKATFNGKKIKTSINSLRLLTPRK